MKKVLVSFVVAAAVFMPTKFVFAKDSNSILVIDIEKIANESLAGKDMQLKIQKQQKKIQSQIEEKKAELTKKAQKLQEKKSSLPPKEFEEKANNLQNEIMVLDGKFQEDIEDLQKQQQNASQVIIDKVKEISAKIAKKHGSIMVVASNSVFYADDNINITSEVIKSLDKDFPKVNIE